MADSDNVSDLTVIILREIRDEMRATREEVRETNKRLDATNERLEGLSQRQDVTNERLGIVEHTLLDMSAHMLESSRLLKKVANRHDDEIEDLRTRVTRLETVLKPE